MPKDNFRKIICISLILGVVPFYSVFAETGKINGNAVRLRTEPSTDAKIITLLEKDKEVEVLKEENGWYQIKTGKNTGWVSKELIAGVNSKTVDALSSNPVQAQANETEQMIVAVTGNSVNLRKEPHTGASIVGKVVKGDNLIATEKVSNDEWYKIKFGDIEGYVYAELVTTDVKAIMGTGKINDTVNFRENPSTDANIISKLSTGTQITITDTKDEWYKVVCNDKEGWIVARCVDRVTSTSRSGSNSTVQKIIDLAKKQLGKKYVWGAEGPNSFDCSGLMQYVFGKAGISLNRTSYNQATQGIKVSKSKLIPGDLVFFNGINSSSGSTKVSHVGLYIGNGEFIHASNPSRGVVKDALSEDYYTKHYVTARRIVR